MDALLSLALLAAGMRGDPPQPGKIQVELAERPEYVRLPPTGEPPTAAVAIVTQLVDPATGRAFAAAAGESGCDPRDLRRTFRLDRAEVLVGEPVLVELRTELAGPGRWRVPTGGFGRGLARDPGFFFLMRRRDDGAWAADPLAGHEFHSFGGIGGAVEVRRGQPRFEWQAVQPWCVIDRPGVYDLYAFAWGAASPPVGLRACLAAALPPGRGERLEAHPFGFLIDRDTRVMPDDLDVRPSVVAAAGPSPIAALIPAEVRAGRALAWDRVTDFAHFTLTVRAGTPAERQAMVRRWIDPPDPPADPAPDREDAEPQSRGVIERAEAADQAIALAAQDDFLPEIARRLAAGQFDGPLAFGLALRDDPRAVAILLDSGSARDLEMLRYLRPTQVPAAIARLIDLLTSPDDATRALAEEALRGWTGQSFGHTWDGFRSTRPTPAEGRAMQAAYRAWWDQNRLTFAPRWRDPG